MSKTTLALASVLVLAVGAAAERVIVSNRGAASLDFFDSVSGASEGRVVVGASPVDLAPDAPDTFGPTRVFVANSGSNTVSVVGVNPAGVAATITGGGTFGSFQTPSGVVRHPSGAIVVVDQKPTTFPGTPAGRSTIRFLSPTSFTVLDSYRDASASARYNDVVVTDNGRVWVADDGDQGVTVVHFPNSAPPFFFPQTLIFNGSGAFADFIHDPAATPAFLVAPRRLATNGTTRVVAADAGSPNLSILDARYSDESAAVLANVGLGAGVTIHDVEVVGNFAFATTSGASNFHRIDLTTFTVLSTALAGTVQGIGATSDGSAIFVGAGAGSGDIQRLDLTVPFPPAPALVPPFVPPGDFPFAFYSSVRDASEVPGPGGANPDPPFISQSNTGTTSEGDSNTCGLMGLEVVFLFLAWRLVQGRGWYARQELNL